MKEKLNINNKEALRMENERLTEQQKAVLKEVEAWVENKFKEGPAGHSVEHVRRVVENAIEICRIEEGNEFLVTLAAWLHDLGRIPEAEKRPYSIGSYKVRRDHANLSRWEGSEKLRELYSEGKLTIDEWQEIQRAVIQHSRYIKDPKRRTKLLEILQDADRMDVFGLTGLVRCLNHAKERGVPVETTELLPEFSDADYPNLHSWDDAKSALSHLWYVYNYKDGFMANGAKERAEPRARIYRDFIELLKSSIPKKEGLSYEFWLEFLDYAKKRNLERLSEADLEKFKRLRKD